MSYRNDAIAKLATLFTGNAAFNAVYAGVPTTLVADKILAIYAAPSSMNMPVHGAKDIIHRIALLVMVKRTSTPSTAEYALGTARDAIETVIRANVQNECWNSIDLEKESTPGFYEESGVEYREETHFVNVYIRRTT